MRTMRRGGGVGSSSSTGGEIIQVQGGHIIRATGRKDRHSKVYTAKGPRDRRVRLAAHTAIQFYDVQDRLGYDRPSKAVDWLINKAKDAIDRLDRLPPFDPASSDSRIRNFHAGLLQVAVNQHPNDSLDVGPSEADLEMVAGGGAGRGRDEGDQSHESSTGYNHLLPHQICLDDSQSMVGETMRSFFPGATNQEDEQMNSIGGYHHHHLFYPKAVQPHHQQVQHHQDLGLSLQTFHDDPEGNPTAAPTPQTGFQQAGFQVTTTAVPHGGSNTTTTGDDTWPDNINQLHHNHPPSLPLQNEMGRFSRLMAWTGGFGESLPGQGIVIGSGNLPSPPPVLLGERFHHQEQQPSSSIRAWENLPLPLGFRDNHHNQTSIEIGISHTNSPRTSNDTRFVTGFCIPPGTTESHHHEHGNRIVAQNHNVHGTSGDNNSSSMSKDTNH